MKYAACFISLLVVGIAESAERNLDVSQLVGSVTSAFAVDRNDKRIARSLKSMRLTESLTEETTGLLLKMGAGPETARALQMLQRQSARLPLPPAEVLATSPAPSESELREITLRAQHYVSEYLLQFPDFIATENVRQFHNYEANYSPSVFPGADQRLISVDDRWHEGIVYTTEIADAAGREYHEKRGAGKDISSRITRISRGEFGGMLAEILGPGRDYKFGWDRWEVVNCVRTAVLRYNVDTAASRYTVSYRVVDPGGKSRAQNVNVGHRGLVYVDPRSGAVMRLILYAIGFPELAEVNAAGHVLDYGEVNIGGKSYFIPVRSIAYVRVGQYESREEIEYSHHRKFSSEATINFIEDPADHSTTPAGMQQKPPR